MSSAEAQTTEAQGKDIMRIICLWQSLEDQIRKRIGDDKFDQLEQMFQRGCAA
jgi:hypothetical protein